MPAVVNLTIMRLSPGAGLAGAAEGAVEELIGSILVGQAPLITIAATPLVFDMPAVPPPTAFGAQGAGALPYLAVAVLSGAVLIGVGPQASPSTRLLVRAAEPPRLFALRGSPRVAIVEAATLVTIPVDIVGNVTFNGDAVSFGGQPVTFGA